MTTLIKLPKALAFILLLPLLSAVGLAETVTVYLENGTERQISINIPMTQFGKSDHYRKAYVLEYMEWWNIGIGLSTRNLPYTFDREKYKNTTPPLEIDKRVEQAVRDHFLKGNPRKGDSFYRKVEREAQAYLQKVRYTGDQNVSEMVVDKIGGLGLQPNIKVPIPPRFSSRAEEYAKAYAIQYMRHWNSLWLEKSDDYPNLSITRNSYDFGRYERREPFVSGDIKKYVEQVFAREGIDNKVADALEEHLKAQSKKKK
ncbi:hypothetical protein AXK12_06205 [Cephaloticoccus capnophilus]|uniref:Uncharacterized protein n=1 Tax=Cephaloticoccus capnophilus TaxID=1548208 RepID=A0A139SKD8_9BACT|nr:hypothetical protein [Cephaloticoccus capnophilus]KXU34957.1 hypothetical protein AXK12_06205 [Cephaloticoccus capnophilus]